MKLIIGLGNPGKKYESTKHNVGFMAIDALVEQLIRQGHAVDFKRKFESEYAKVNTPQGSYIILKPQTYMNLSGKAVREVVNFFDIEIEDILVIYDDMDLSLGKIKIKPKGSSGGQKGMQNIIDQLKTPNIARFRIGIGRPAEQTIEHVLSRFSKSETVIINQAIETCVQACLTFVKTDLANTMTQWNCQHAN